MLHPLSTLTEASISIVVFEEEVNIVTTAAIIPMILTFFLSPSNSTGMPELFLSPMFSLEKKNPEASHCENNPEFPKAKYAYFVRRKHRKKKVDAWIWTESKMAEKISSNIQN